MRNVYMIYILFALYGFILVFPVMIQVSIIKAKRRRLQKKDVNNVKALPKQIDLDALSKLFEMKEKGILSQKEFNEAKARLL